MDGFLIYYFRCTLQSSQDNTTTIADSIEVEKINNDLSIDEEASFFCRRTRVEVAIIPIVVVAQAIVLVAVFIVVVFVGVLGVVTAGVFEGTGIGAASTIVI